MTTDRENDASRPAGQRRRLLGWTFLLVSILVFLGAAAVRQVALGGEAARRSIAGDLSELTVLPVTFGGGKTEFRLLPVPRLSLDRVEIGRATDGPRLTIARLTADLDLWAALLGRTEIDRLVLVTPELSAPPGTAPDASMPETFAPFLSRLHGLGDVEIRDGLLSRGSAGRRAIVSAANLRLSWPKEGSAASLSGTYAWNGQPVRLDLRLASPLAWLDGRTSMVDFDMTSPQLDLAFDGEASPERLSGRVRAALPSLTRSLRWLTQTRVAVPEIGPLSIAADLISDRNRVDLADAEVSIDGFSGRGALDIVFPPDRRPSLGGTLAFERLDFDGLSRAIAPLPESPIEAARPIPTGFADRLDIDLRVSASEGRIGPLALNDIAGTVKLKDGLATLDIGDAGLLGGNGQMRVGVDTRTAPPQFKGSASLRGVDAGGLLSALGLASGTLSGSADLGVTVEAPVTSWADIYNRHRMDGSIAVRSGALAGLDPQGLRVPGTSRFDAAAGTSVPFTSLKADIQSRGSRITLTSLRILGESGIATAAGLLADADGRADLRGSFQPETEASTSALTKPKPIALRMRGAWPHPSIVASAAVGGE